MRSRALLRRALLSGAGGARYRSMRGAGSLLVAAVVLAWCAPPTWSRSAAQATDPLAFLAPTVILSSVERQALERGEPVFRTLDSASEELAVFGAVRIGADGQRLASWIRRVADLKRSTRVPAIARFSAPATPADIASLRLPDAELADLRRCRPGRCDLKLSLEELGRVAAVVSAGVNDDGLQKAFRDLMVARAQSYQTRGQATAVLTPLLSRTPFLPVTAPTLGPYLEQFPSREESAIEAFVYWALEELGAKPTVTLTHVAMVRPSTAFAPELIVAGRQFFATHYVDEALNLTMVTRPTPQGVRYLVFVNRSRVDVLGGLLGSVKRWAVERKLRSDGRDLLIGLRERIESGEPGETR